MAKNKKICLSKVPNSKVIANNLPNSVNNTIVWNFRYVELNHPYMRSSGSKVLTINSLTVIFNSLCYNLIISNTMCVSEF